MSFAHLWNRLTRRDAGEEEIEIDAHDEDLIALAGALPRLSKEMLEKLEWSREQARMVADTLAADQPMESARNHSRSVRLPERDWKRIYRLIAIMRQQGIHGWTTRVMARISAGAIKAHRWP